MMLSTPNRLQRSVLQGKSLVVGVALLAAIVPGQPAFAAEAVAPSASAAAPKERQEVWAKLDGLLAKQDYRAVSAHIEALQSQPEAMATLDWLGAQFMQGPSAMIAYTYAKLLGEFANGTEGETARQLRGTVLAAGLYALLAADIDGQQCADLTARANRAEQFAGILGRSNLREYDEETRRNAVLIAMGLENRGWERRKQMDDTRFLCANGMAAMMAGLRAGQAREVEPREGQIGRQVSVKVPEDFKYERRANADWWPEAEKRRAAAAGSLYQLMGVKPEE